MMIYDIYDRIFIYLYDHIISKTITKILATREVRMYDVMRPHPNILATREVRKKHTDW